MGCTPPLASGFDIPASVASFGMPAMGHPEEDAARAYLLWYQDKRFEQIALWTRTAKAVRPELFFVGGPLNGLGQYLMLVQNQMALVAGMVMGIMLIPFVSSLSDDIINAVPQSLRDGSYAMGATKSETVTRVLMPAALPGVAGALLLAVSRAIGETMIVTMAAGLAARLTLNPLDTVTTVTVQIVTLLTGDQEFDSPKTLAAFGLGLTLFLATLMLNIVAQKIVQTYRQQYD